MDRPVARGPRAAKRRDQPERRTHRHSKLDHHEEGKAKLATQRTREHIQARVNQRPDLLANVCGDVHDSTSRH